MSDYFEDTLGDEPDAAVVRWMDRPPLHVGAAALSSAVAGAFLLGAVAAFGLARSGKLFIRAVAGLALGFAFFVADNFAMAMADFGTYPPWAAAWAPFMLFLLVGELVLIRTEE